MISNGVAEAGPEQNIYSQLFADDMVYYFKQPGIHFKLFDIKTGKLLRISDFTSAASVV